MNKDTIVTSAFRVHHSKFSCSLAAALLDDLFEHPAGYSGTIAIREITATHRAKPSFPATC
jgi:hypothetical protein